MYKKTYYLFLLIFFSTIIGCTDESIINRSSFDTEGTVKEQTVTLSAEFQNNKSKHQTRASLYLNDESLKLKAHWTNNDKIWVYCQVTTEMGAKFIPAKDNPVSMKPNPTDPGKGSFTFTIPDELANETSINIVGCMDPYYDNDNQPQITDDGHVVFALKESQFYNIKESNVRIPMFFKHEINTDAGTSSITTPVQFKSMGSFILLSLKNVSNSTSTGKFNWTTSPTGSQQFYYSDKGFKTACYDGAGDIIDGHFSDNSIIDINNISHEAPTYSIEPQETIKLAAWFAPVKDTEISNITINFEMEGGAVCSSTVNLESTISPKIGKAYAFYGNIEGSNLSIAKEKYLDVTDIDGTFVVCEGNMTTTNGMLVYYDKNGTEYVNAFKNVNRGLEIGNVVQDMYMANGKVYLLTQNGNNMGGAGRFVVCNAKTMVMEYADPLIIKTPEGKEAWPQHLVVTSEKDAYVQYAEKGFEATSGIVRLELGDGTVSVKETVVGTFGPFTKTGATKARMVYSRGKIFVGLGEGVGIIDPISGELEKEIPFEGQQVKGIVKAADGNIYFALAGKYEGNQNWGTIFTSPAQIVGINHSGEIISTKDCPSEIELPVATWSPSINMGASFTDPHLYFVDKAEFSATTASRYNYETKTFDINYISLDGYDSIYGIMGVHPTTKKLWVGRSTNSYTTGTVYVFDVSGNAPVLENEYYYPSQMGASPAGIDFGYRFTSTWINK